MNDCTQAVAEAIVPGLLEPLAADGIQVFSILLTHGSFDSPTNRPCSSLKCLLAIIQEHRRVRIDVSVIGCLEIDVILEAP